MHIFDKIKAEGIAKGEAKGIAVGEAKGLAKGEEKSKKEFIKTLARETELSVQEIARLVKVPVRQVKAVMDSL